MGRPLDPSPVVSSASSLSVTSTVDDQPPSYDQEPPSYHEDANTLTTASPPPDHNDNHNTSNYTIPGSQRYNSVSTRKRHGGIVTLDGDLSHDGAILDEFITRQTALPPRPCLIISGHHRETHKHGDKTETKTVSDFDFRLDLTSTLLPRGQTPDWTYTAVVGDHDGDRAYRGGRWKTRARKAGRIALPEDEEDAGTEGQRLMDLENGEDGPGIRGWCYRFCRDPAPVKSFTYRRNLSGFDVAPMRSALIGHIRSTGYRGHISIQPSLSSSVITIYSPHWINTLRNNTFVFWFCVILQLWLLTWPVIWLLERRYDVVRSEWFTAKEVADPVTQRVRKVYAGGCDEATAAEIWGPVVREAAWRQCTGGEFLSNAEVVRLRQLAASRTQGGAGGEGIVARGQAVLGMMGIREVAGVNVTGAWGGDRDHAGSGSGSRFSLRMGSVQVG